MRANKSFFPIFIITITITIIYTQKGEADRRKQGEHANIKKRALVRKTATEVQKGGKKLFSHTPVFCRTISVKLGKERRRAQSVYSRGSLR